MDEEVDVEDYPLLNLHITFSGDINIASSYLPYAKAKVRALLQDGEDIQVRHYTPAPGVLVRIRLISDERWIHIEAKGGCTDRRGFLLSRRGTSNVYDALYTDNKLENINPIDGSPRPDPDLAVRTRGYKVPGDLRLTGFARRSASRYSGMMRTVVGCYHLAGRDSPFKYEHAITHGIVRKTVQINNKPVVKHWVVEINSGGVFAASITGTGKCCDSWDVKQYMPTIPPAPPPTILSLRGRFIAGDARIKVLASAAEMATVYASGVPFFDQHGWAFSASGAEAQAVVQRGGSSGLGGFPHYICSRWKITFTTDPQGNLGATVTAVETDKRATFKRNSVLWFPVLPGLWEATYGAVFDAEFAFLPTQNAPVAVYYVGESEKVLRWTLDRAENELSDTGPYVRAPALEPPLESITTCPYSASNPLLTTPSGGTSFHHNTDVLTSRHKVFAHTSLTYGFSCPQFSHVGLGGTTTQTSDIALQTGSSPDGPVIGPFSNTYDLEPDCYYLDGETLVTRCTSQLEAQAKDRFVFWWDNIDAFHTFTNDSGAVLYPEEREAFLGVRLRTERIQDSTIHVWDGPGHVCRDVRATKVDSGPCPYVETHQEEGNAVVCNADIELPSIHTTSSDVTTRNAFATLCVGPVVTTEPITMGPPPFFAYDNYNLGTFLENHPTTKPNAESNVRAMHGNLFYPDPKLIPPDQSSNAAFQLNLEYILGGFPDPADPAGFVGKA